VIRLGYGVAKVLPHGALAIRAADLYGAEVLGIAPSVFPLLSAQRAVAPHTKTQEWRSKRLPEQQEDSFDCIISCGIVERLTANDLNEHFRLIRRVLAPRGTALVHGLTSREPLGGIATATAAWLVGRYGLVGPDLPHARV
jgi:cyclopropane-fatty-acyl-phospholipid synthase